VVKDIHGVVVLDTHFQYDLDGNVTTRTDGDGNVTTSIYLGDQLMHQEVRNAAGQLASSVDFTYDRDGYVASETDGDGNSTVYTNDVDSNVLSMTTPLGTTTYQYDRDGNRTYLHDPLGRSIVYSYDDNRLATAIWYNANGSVANVLSYGYDEDGNLTSASNNAGSYTFHYDGDELTQEVTPGGVVINFTQHDEQGNATQITDSFGATLTAHYNADGRLDHTTYSDAGSQAREDMVYDNAGLLVSQSRYADTAGTTLVGTTAVGYHGPVLIGVLQHSDGAGIVLASFTYGYDTAGWLTSESTNGANTIGYGYDGAGQLTQAGEQTWGYDPNGNPNTGGAVVAGNNQLVTDGTWTYQYDAAGNVISRTDAAAEETWTYSYDTVNELVSATETGPFGVVLVQADYSYDAFGNRISVTVTQDGETTTTHSVYVAVGSPEAGADLTHWRLWADTDGSGTLQTHYLSGDQPDQWLARVDAGANGVRWLLPDKQGSVRLVADNTEGVIDQINYNPWGVTTTETAPEVGGQLKYAGYAQDAWSQMYHEARRYYQADAHRFLTQDPLGLEPDSNPYRPVGNGPTNATDPSGLIKQDVFWDNVEAIADADPAAKHALAWFKRHAGANYQSKVTFGYYGNWYPWYWVLPKNTGRYEAGGQVPTVSLSTSWNEWDNAVGFYEVLLKKDIVGFATDVRLDQGDPDKLIAALKKDRQEWLKTAVQVVAAAGRGLLEAYSMQAGIIWLTIDNLQNKQYLLAGLRVIPLVGSQTVKIVLKTKAGDVTVSWTADQFAKLRRKVRAQGKSLDMEIKKALKQAETEHLAKLARQQAPAPAPPATSVSQPRVQQTTAPLNDAGASTSRTLADQARVAAQLRTTGPTCFATGTPLLTPGGFKRVEHFRPGDLILSRCETDPSGSVEAKTVEEVFVRVAMVLKLRIGGQEIRTTAEHPFYVVGKGWVKAAFLEVGQLLLGHDGQCTAVEELSETRSIETVYNLRVADYHTYFVGSPEWGFSVWAHNADYVARFEVLTGGWVVDIVEGGKVTGQAKVAGNPMKIQTFTGPNAEQLAKDHAAALTRQAQSATTPATPTTPASPAPATKPQAPTPTSKPPTATAKDPVFESGVPLSRGQWDVPRNAAESAVLRNAQAGAGRTSSSHRMIVSKERIYGDPYAASGNYEKWAYVETRGGVTYEIHYMRNVVTGETGHYKFVSAK
jgi:RHS repeat-associated protein